MCPICKKDLTLTDVYTLNKNKKITTNVNENEQKILEKYGSKLGKIIVMIKKIIINPDSRIIIFSQWDHMLSLIGQSLSENGIANSFIKGNVWSRNNAISKFKSGKTLSGDNNRIIMLSLKNSASGTNLTEATHIFFVDPINANKEECKAIEGQAIGRAVRIGQLKKVKLFRFLVKNTIEEDIYLKNL
jgi:SNF2 family DNA or RNA helicase